MARLPSKWGSRSKISGLAAIDAWTMTALNQPDFSSTTDLYQVVANIYAIDFTSVAMFGVALLLPFVPVTLLIVPLDKVLAGLKSLLL